MEHKWKYAEIMIVIMEVQEFTWKDKLFLDTEIMEEFIMWVSFTWINEYINNYFIINFLKIVQQEHISYGEILLHLNSVEVFWSELI